VQRISSLLGVPRFLRVLARPLAFVALWLTAVGFFGIAYFLSGRRPPRDFEIMAFTIAFAIAAALSAGIVLFLGDKKRWALEAALFLFILIAIPAGVAYMLLWLAPSRGQSLLGMSYPDFLQFRQQVLVATWELARLTAPTGTILGIGIGTIAGLLFLVARRWPRLIGWLVVGLMLGCVSSSVHVIAFGRVTELVLKARLEGVHGVMYAWAFGSELHSAIGAITGAVVGAVGACLVRWQLEPRRLGRSRENLGHGGAPDAGPVAT
jgi:hypothetical protein